MINTALHIMARLFGRLALLLLLGLYSLSLNAASPKEQAATIIANSEEFKAFNDYYRGLGRTSASDRRMDAFVEDLTVENLGSQDYEGLSRFRFKPTSRAGTLARDAAVLNQAGELVYINFYPSSAKDIAFLSRFKALKGLIIDRNGLGFTLDLRPLAQLEELQLFKNKFTNIIFSGNNQLRVFGSSLNPLTTINFEALTALEYFDIHSTEFSELDGLVASQNLIAIDVRGNNLQSLPSLTHFKQLESLKFFSPAIKTLDGLASAKNLKYLSTTFHFDLANAEFPESLEELHTAQIGGTAFPELNHLKNLKVLDLGGTTVEEVPNLKNLKNLKNLSLVGNKIKRISGLETLTKLKVVDFSRNQIEKIEGLETLENLEVLDLENNNITTVEGIKNNKKLKKVNLNENQISRLDFAEVEHLTFAQLFLGDNPYYKSRSEEDKQKLHNLRHKGHF